MACHITRAAIGVKNGVNQVFKTPTPYLPGEIIVIRNGQKLPPECITEIDWVTVNVGFAPESLETITLHFIPRFP